MLFDHKSRSSPLNLKDSKRNVRWYQDQQILLRKPHLEIVVSSMKSVIPICLGTVGKVQNGTTTIEGDGIGQWIWPYQTKPRHMHLPLSKQSHF